MGGSQNLTKKLLSAETRVEQIDGLLAQAQESVAAPIARNEVREFVEREIGNIADILLADPVTASRTNCGSTFLSWC
jgi:hypothetical protein